MLQIYPGRQDREEGILFITPPIQGWNLMYLSLTVPLISAGYRVCLQVKRLKAAGAATGSVQWRQCPWCTGVCISIYRYLPGKKTQSGPKSQFWLQFCHTVHFLTRKQLTDNDCTMTR